MTERERRVLEAVERVRAARLAHVHAKLKAKIAADAASETEAIRRNAMADAQQADDELVRIAGEP